MSLSARRAWIEITSSREKQMYPDVALRKESVDRNLVSGINRTVNIVALRKESVDRNPLVAGSLITLGGSLSARRAWIEML